MKLKNKDAVRIVNGIVNMQEREAKTGEKIFDRKPELNFRLIKNKIALTKALEPYNTAVSQLMEECRSEESKNENIFIPRKDMKKHFNRTLEEYQDIEVDADIQVFKQEEIKNLNILSMEMEVLMTMME